MKTIKQLSEDLNISREAIYKKIKHQLSVELQGHVIKLDNVTHIDPEGQQIIIQSLTQDRREAIENLFPLSVESDINIQNQSIEPYSQSDLTAEYIGLLLEQLKSKDEQLITANNQINQLIDQIGRQWVIRAEKYEMIMQLLEDVPQKQRLQNKPHKPQNIWNWLMGNRNTLLK